MRRHFDDEVVDAIVLAAVIDVFGLLQLAVVVEVHYILPLGGVKQVIIQPGIGAIIEVNVAAQRVVEVVEQMLDVHHLPRVRDALQHMQAVNREGIVKLFQRF